MVSARDRSDEFLTPIGREIWDAKYRHRVDGRVVDHTVTHTWHRVARAVAEAESPDARATWTERFDNVLSGFHFLPGGRILAGAGTGRDVTLFNCFVMGLVDDSMDGIFSALREGAITMQKGGGIGYDFSTLRPSGCHARGTGSIASGPVSFMRIWDAMCGTILSTGARRGAMMATLRCDHPDIEIFIGAKEQRGELTRFNLSVQVTDEFMTAVHKDRQWELVFPCEALGETPEHHETVTRRWPGTDGPVPCRVFRRVSARALWRRIMRATYDYAEPGVLFVDAINRWNNLAYGEHITATNPCGEIPLPPYGACNLGSLNLTTFVQAPFSRRAAVDRESLRATVEVAVRMLDNVIEVSRFPLPEQREQAHGTRRIGLGVTGLADALIMMGLHYDSDAARKLAGEIMETVCVAAYRASTELAREKGAFPGLNRTRYLGSPFVAKLPPDIRRAIADHGIRNSHLTAIAPTGTISLLAGNVSSGIEPVYRLEHRRKVRTEAGEREYRLLDHAYDIWRRDHGEAPIPETFADALQLPPQAHLRMQAAIQPWVDNAVSKTINVPTEYDFNDFLELYDLAHSLGLKGCTTFRANPVTGAVLESVDEGAEPLPVQCCGVGREPD